MSWFISVLSIILMLGSKGGNLYADTFLVTDVCNEYVSCIDYSGECYCFTTDPGDWSVGDLVGVIMYDNGTQSIYDDEILSAKYVGVLDHAWGDCRPCVTNNNGIVIMVSSDN